MKSLLHHFNISPTGTRGSAVIYGSSPQTVAGFTDPKLQIKLNSAPLLRTPRRIDRALEHAARMLLNSQRQGQKIVVLITAGAQAPGGKSFEKTGKALREFGIKVYVISVGKQSVEKDYSSLVYSQHDVIRFPSFDTLPWQGEMIGEKIRNSSSMLSFCAIS